MEDQSMGKYLIISVTCLLVLTLIFAPSAGEKGDDLEELIQLLSSLNDPKITVSDLAFLLATHNYDAWPAKGYVELRLNGKIFKLIPNGDDPGLCNVIPSDVYSI
jgi:hypothetical protein